MLALLGGLGGVALAQSEPVSHEAALFEGTATCGQAYLVGTNPVIEEGRLVSRGDGWEGAFDVSDPRLAGTYRNTSKQDTHVTGSAVWTIATRIDNAEGS